MNRYLCFPVTVNVDNEVSTLPDHNKALLFEAETAEGALEQAANQIALHIGENIAVFPWGRILNKSAGDTLTLGQASG